MFRSESNRRETKRNETKRVPVWDLTLEGERERENKKIYLGEGFTNNETLGLPNRLEGLII